MTQDENIGKAMYVKAVHFQTTADGLQRIAKVILNQPNMALAQTEMALSYMMSVPVLRALAAECVLKALSEKSTGEYKPTHDLVELYNNLNNDVKRVVTSIAVNQGVLPPLTILKNHRTDFVDWRYPFKDSTVRSPDMPDLQNALAVLMTTWNHHDFLKLCKLVESTT